MLCFGLFGRSFRLRGSVLAGFFRGGFGGLGIGLFFLSLRFRRSRGGFGILLLFQFGSLGVGLFLFLLGLGRGDCGLRVRGLLFFLSFRGSGGGSGRFVLVGPGLLGGGIRLTGGWGSGGLAWRRIRSGLALHVGLHRRLLRLGGGFPARQVGGG